MADEQPLPHPDRVREFLDDWRSRDLDGVDQATVDQSFVDLLQQLEVIAEPFTEGPTIATCYRARPKDEPWPWTERQDLLYHPDGPPNRCNAEGDPVLYCARKESVALREVRAAVGDEVALIRYRVFTARPKLTLALIRPKSNPTGHADGVPVFVGDELESYELLREFVLTEFTRPVGDDEKHLYRIPAAMCRKWFNPHVDGWVYPSVQAPEEDCVAVRAAFADQVIEVMSAEIVRVVAVQDGCYYVRTIQECAGLEPSLSWEPVSDATTRLLCSSKRDHSHCLALPTE